MDSSLSVAPQHMTCLNRCAEPRDNYHTVTNKDSEMSFRFVRWVFFLSKHKTHVGKIIIVIV